LFNHILSTNRLRHRAYLRQYCQVQVGGGVRNSCWSMLLLLRH
jgi:hypothetical protein